MGNCVFSSATSAVSSSAQDAKGNTIDKANTKLDAWTADKPPEPMVDNMFDKIVNTGNNLLFNTERVFEQQKKEQVRKKNKKQMDSIRNKYIPPPKAPVAAKKSEAQRKSYNEVKARLSASTG